MIDLSKISTRAPEGLDKDKTKKKTEKIAKRIGELAEIMKAQKKHSLLIVFQGMDSSGKDGSTEHVFGATSPSHVSVKGFKKPTEEEFAHDFLWRVTKEAPAKGMIKIFVRSHYEDILVQRVHKWVTEERVTQRINAINAWETLLIEDNNTTILKFYLHLSKERQEEKLQERIDIPEKNWKHNPGDWEERKFWDEYMRVYEDAINRSVVPWIIAPVDQRWYRNYFIASKVLETMENMDLEFPILKDGQA
ncbi:PPK2 family polyphosphate kinase [Portibacter lacus]|uniref:Polyphosphate kinase n=1 Tax=Portibacter lacus TaxID=1099794 RepID=A0AA37SJ70_9BACT|nr:PPK2 family polyphosphate kinase [Portibacter lacus]GLR15406.1 polyphosphate kinase [Portibacter lacus]